MHNEYVKKILKAKVYDVAIETPLDDASMLSERIGNRVLLKREDLQPVFSFKIRGAYNSMVNLPVALREKGVVCASAGNHAQGVALAAQKLGVKAWIVMPKTTPEIKVESVKARGGIAVLHGDSYDDAYQHAMKLVEEKGLTFLHPFDNPDVIAGQGTVAVELLSQQSGELDAVFIPVGGGGLIAGMAAYIKYLRPEVKVIAVEPVDSACLDAALKANSRVILKEVGIFADGVAVKQIGEETFKLAQQFVDEVVTVNTDEICAAIKDNFEDTRVLAEPAGALSIAGLKKYVQQHQLKGKTLAAVVSGANINFDRLRHVAERAEVGEQREAILAVKLPEEKGAYRRFIEVMGRRAITEFNYRFNPGHDAVVYVGVRLTEGNQERQQLLELLEGEGYSVIDMTDNELAKMHVRHMVGGREDVEDERVYRFEFPERPGALSNFLAKMKARWNISLFHYRNHGAAFGRVLLGIQVPKEEIAQLHASLDELGYRYTEEADNPAYKAFLAG
ncbi:threonine ammonia-lyase, biosynthetic [Pelagibaculum spongiae]|uniref:L-threonine dehydratase n=2 Tax=Pelagibaculum spongiae TaxID=2080658 RepID=A0A2V1H6B2_9GAMM|nr:threonine ammonia-lyase, biosynthetic [Pelagibaculum spongiae]